MSGNKCDNFSGEAYERRALKKDIGGEYARYVELLVRPPPTPILSFIAEGSDSEYARGGNSLRTTVSAARCGLFSAVNVSKATH